MTHSSITTNPDWAAPKSRIRRPEAEHSLVSAVIDLMDETPIAEITIHQIAQIAGVNFGYINRYFDSRLNLFAVVTDELADLAVAQLKELTSAPKEIKREKTKDFSYTDREKTRAATMPLGVKRLKMVQYLVAAGVPTERFVAKSRESLEAAIALTSQRGLDPALARARMIHGISMMWAKATLTPVLGISDDELENAFTLFFEDLLSGDFPRK